MGQSAITTGAGMMSKGLLEVEALSVKLNIAGNSLAIVDDISFSINWGEIVTLVGESGCGKSTAAMALAKLNGDLDEAFTISGRVNLCGKNVLALNNTALQRLRGQGVAMVFQDAATSLNPCETIGYQIAESLVVHGLSSWTAARLRSVELLEEVGLPEPSRRAGLYPHQLSGGQRQRAMIALALACNPQLLIADEPTTALDVTIQAQILALLKDLVQNRDMGMLLITHDLGVVAAMSDRVLVIYAGQVVEEGSVSEILNTPFHPYTEDLINAAKPDQSGHLVAIPGMPPKLNEPFSGCSYAPRCSHARNCCSTSRPPTFQHGNRSVVCYFADQVVEHWEKELT